MLRALLEREGELLGEMASILWRCLRALQADGDVRDGRLPPKDASSSYGLYSNDVVTPR